MVSTNLLRQAALSLPIGASRRSGFQGQALVCGSGAPSKFRREGVAQVCPEDEGGKTRACRHLHRALVEWAMRSFLRSNLAERAQVWQPSAHRPKGITSGNGDGCRHTRGAKR